MSTKPEAMMMIGLVWVLAPENYRSETLRSSTEHRSNLSVGTVSIERYQEYMMFVFLYEFHKCRFVIVNGIMMEPLTNINKYLKNKRGEALSNYYKCVAMPLQTLVVKALTSLTEVIYTLIRKSRFYSSWYWRLRFSFCTIDR